MPAASGTPHHSSAPVSSPDLRQKTSHETEHDSKHAHPPRQSLPSIHEALNPGSTAQYTRTAYPPISTATSQAVEQPSPLARKTNTTYEADGTAWHARSYGPPSPRASAARSPFQRRAPSPYTKPEHDLPSSILGSDKIPIQSRSPKPTYINSRSDNVHRPFASAESFESARIPAPPIHHVPADATNSTRSAIGYDRHGESRHAYHHQAQPLSMLLPSQAKSHQNGTSLPPLIPTSIYTSPTRYVSSMTSNDHTLQPTKEHKPEHARQAAPYGQAVKRHLEIFDLESSLNKVNLLQSCMSAF